MAYPYATYFFAGSKLLSFLAFINVLTLFGVPLLSIILFLSKYVFRTRTSPHFKAGMWAFMIVNVISLFAIASYQGSQFNSQSESAQEIDLSGIKSDTLQIKIEADPYRSASFDIGHLKISDEKLISRHVHLNIRKADGADFELTQELYSRGRSENEAIRLVNAIHYNLRVVDNAIIFPEIIEISKEEKWRNQHVSLTLRIPEGKSIYLHNDLWHIGHHINVDRNQDYPRFADGQTWRMDPNGLVNLEFLRKSQRSDEFKFKDFENLQIDGKLKVTIEKGDNFKIAMSGRPNSLDEVEIVQLDKTLSLNFETHRYSPIEITITMPQLKSIDAKGTNGIKIQGFTQKEMRVKHDGNDDLSVLAKIDSIYLIQSSRSKVILKGEGMFLDAVLGKRTKLDADRFRVKKAKVNAGISANAKVAVSDSLWQYTDSGARVSVDGSPFIDAKSVHDH